MPILRCVPAATGGHCGQSSEPCLLVPERQQQLHSRGVGNPSRSVPLFPLKLRLHCVCGAGTRLTQHMAVSSSLLVLNQTGSHQVKLGSLRVVSSLSLSPRWFLASHPVLTKFHSSNLAPAEQPLVSAALLHCGTSPQKRSPVSAGSRSPTHAVVQARAEQATCLFLLLCWTFYLISPQEPQFLLEVCPGARAPSSFLFLFLTLLWSSVWTLSAAQHSTIFPQILFLKSYNIVIQKAIS